MADPNIAQRGPFIKEMEPGNYAWCACGLSKTQPLCDGSHKDTDFKPVVVKIEEKKTVVWCGCKNTNNPPYCDGSHSKL